MKKHVKNDYLFYAPLDSPIGLTGSAAQNLAREQYHTTLYGRPSTAYSTVGTAAHKKFAFGTKINNSSGWAFASSAMYGRPFPQQGTIEFWIHPETTLSNYDGVFSTNGNSVEGNNRNKIKAFYDYGNGLWCYFANTGFTGFNLGALTAGTNYLITISWDFSRSYAVGYKNGAIQFTSSSITSTYRPTSWRTFELGRAKRDDIAYTPDASFNGLYISEQFTSLAEHKNVYNTGTRDITQARVLPINLFNRFTTSGGLQLSGTASRSTIKCFTPSGGTKYGGAAAVALYNLLGSHTASGGVVLDGAATIFTGNITTITPSGGLYLSGIADKSRINHFTAQGGLEFSATTENEGSNFERFWSELDQLTEEYRLYGT